MENVHVSKHPLILHKLTRLRDKRTEPKKFRELVREIAILLAYEATQDLTVSLTTVETPMGKAQGHELEDHIGLVPILRAGLGMVEGIWEMMPSAEVWHIGLYRDERTLRPVEYYNKLPVAPTVHRWLCRRYGRRSETLGCSAYQVRRADRRARGHCSTVRRPS